MIRLSKGFIRKLAEAEEEGEANLEKPYFQVIGVKKSSSAPLAPAAGFELKKWKDHEGNRTNYKDRYMLDLSDGESVLEGVMLGSHLNNLVTGTDSSISTAMKIERFGIIQVDEMFCGVSNNKPVMIILEMDVKVRGSDVGVVFGNPVIAAKSDVSYEDCDWGKQGQLQGNGNYSTEAGNRVRSLNTFLERFGKDGISSTELGNKSHVQWADMEDWNQTSAGDGAGDDIYAEKSMDDQDDWGVTGFCAAASAAVLNDAKYDQTYNVAWDEDWDDYWG